MKASESAREAASRIDSVAVYQEARQRFLKDATQQDFELHLMRVAGEHAAKIVITQAEARGREAALREVIAILDLRCDPFDACHEAVATLIPGEPA